MVRVGKFEKVSLEQFSKDMIKTFKTLYSDKNIKFIYDNIKLPKRATKGSAGYDIYSPIDFILEPKETVKMPTGLRVFIEDGWVLKGYPRSGLGFKYRLQLDNTIGVVDADYVYSDNEGHIFAKITNDTHERKTIYISQGEAFMQMIFEQFGITYDDNVTEIRNGGFGSTNTN